MTKSAPLKPFAETGSELSADQCARYARHLNLPGLGMQGQRRLANSRVLVVGAGGLGSPVLLYLAAAGLGHIGVADNDVVDVSNLQRQVIHSTSAIGELKVDSAARRMQNLNPDLTISRYSQRITADNIDLVGADWDLVIDACDNFDTRYSISDYTAHIGVPEVMGAVFRWEGQVTSFWSACPDSTRAVTLRDLYPSAPPPDAPSREPESGILGALCATIGGIMATEAVKLLTGIGQNLLGRVLFYDALDMRLREINLHSSRPSL